MYSSRSMKKFKLGAIFGKQGKFRLVPRVDNIFSIDGEQNSNKDR